MDHPKGASSERGDRVDFDRRVRLEFRGTQLSSDGGLLVMRELDDPLGLSDLASAALSDNRRGKNTLHRLEGRLRQSVYGRLAGYEDVNDADRLACDPVTDQLDVGQVLRDTIRCFVEQDIIVTNLATLDFGVKNQMPLITSGKGLDIAVRSKRRREFILKHLGQIRMTALEIGALDCPTFQKNEEDVYFADYFSRAESVDRHQGGKNHQSSLIVEVDFILRDKSLYEAIDVRPNLIIANHVLEHLPDPIRWLSDLRSISDDSAHLLLSLPDRRFTFDYFKPVSDAIDWLRSFDNVQKMPDRYQILRHLYYHADITGPRAWKNDIPKDHLHRLPMSEAIVRAAELSETYTDIHCSVFTCQSFCNLISDLQHLIPWRIVSVEDVADGENEFKVLLKAAAS